MLPFPDFDEPFLKEALKTIENTNEHFSHRTGMVNIDYGSGGAHYGEKGIYEGNIIDVDFASLYPHIMINFNLASRKIKNPDKIRELMEQRLAFKKAKDPRANSLKIVINSIFGVSGDEHSEIYDKEACFSVCSCGQVIITHLVRNCAPFCRIINVNTDGIFAVVNDETAFKEACNKVSEEVRIPIEFTHYVKMIQRDVNNYIAIAADGSYHSKGRVFKERNELDNECAVIQKALVHHVLHGGFSDYIDGNTDLIDYQMFIRKGKAFDGLYKRYVSPETKLSDTNRVFASIYEEGSVIKLKGQKTYKYPALPKNVRIDNGDVRDKRRPLWVDINYYKEQVRKILDEWGIPYEQKTKVYTLDEFF